ncbi:MAG: DUF5915 domain-containing protein, partial [Bacteroidota bacterium]|nr:DUF5915 domain-containing protein [Bacteroidota bacterium]
NVTDRINIKIEALTGIENAIADYGDYIRTETLADTIVLLHEVVGVAKVEWMEGGEISIDVGIV